ncbi:MAG: TFIIB-type zinc ribbon-containing protein, partial [Lachnospiraceae bacterium]|nr:TFIIB-type zinc ribbon-containing protein [Lachnospiraceae bacterium]
MKCPNCGDNLVFDPRKQRLVCKSCDSEFEINSIDDPESDENVTGSDDEGAKKNKPEKLKAKAEKAEEFNTSDENLEYTTFTCSSCGAGLVATYSESVLGFCPYCGGESILTSRMAGKRPNTIIPFSKTKEECCKQYLEKVNKMPLVPKDLKHEEYINEIRGIYMPYNLYRIKHDGEIHAQYSESHGDKTDYYNIDGDVKADVRIPFDGSSQLDDNIGDIVFPYDPSLEESFDEKYLASYYTELPDVSDESYLEEVREEAMQAEVRALKNDEDSGTYSAKEDQVNSKEKEKMRLTGKKIILSPVYFLTYKNMDRVCYTIIPGTKNDTKTMYAEIPVDRRGYLIILSILTLITFAALSFLPFVPTYKHTETLGIIAMLTSIAMILQWMSYGRSYKKIMKKSMYA